jgi:hypothetical protein
MNLEDLGSQVINRIDNSGVPYMLVGALAAGVYGVPRATRDIDFLVPVSLNGGVNALIKALDDILVFDNQAVFDTLTWGRRHVGKTICQPTLKVELFEIFDDPFVLSEFDRRKQIFIPILNRQSWIPTAEDVIVQKLRWGRSKDLDDVTDILAVQGTENLDMPYIENWCTIHQTTSRLSDTLARIPPL